MAITNTTLSGSIDNLTTQVGVAAVTGITAPNNTLGGKTYLYIKNELMQVYAAPSATSGAGMVPCIRGIGGTKAQSHLSGAPVLIGMATDFPRFQPSVEVAVYSDMNRYEGFSAPVASANTITATGRTFHITGTTLIKTMNLPANFVEGDVVVVFDGVAAWDATGNIAVAGTPTTAGSGVRFSYDAATSKWYPSRLA